MSECRIADSWKPLEVLTKWERAEMIIGQSFLVGLEDRGTRPEQKSNRTTAPINLLASLSPLSAYGKQYIYLCARPISRFPDVL